MQTTHNHWQPEQEEATSAPRLRSRVMTSGPPQPMATMPLSTAFFDMPKIVAAGPVAALCYLASYLWVTRHGTNGAIPAGAMATLTDWAALGVGWKEAAEECVTCGLFNRSNSGFTLRDYHGEGEGR